jgi:hypothetical protein
MVHNSTLHDNIGKIRLYRDEFCLPLHHKDIVIRPLFILNFPIPFICISQSTPLITPIKCTVLINTNTKVASAIYFSTTVPSSLVLKHIGDAPLIYVLIKAVHLDVYST